jgi:hypothetical protein
LAIKVNETHASRKISNNIVNMKKYGAVRIANDPFTNS